MRIDAHADRILNHMYRATSFAAPTTIYGGLLEAVTDLKAGTVTETAYGSYARQAITFGAPAAQHNGRRIQNSSNVTYPTKSDAGTVDIIAVGLYDAATAGNLFDVIFLDADDIPVIGAVNDATADTIKSAAHSLPVDQRVRVVAAPGTGSLPGGLSENTTYWVINSNADDFQLAATQGGAAINITSVGNLMVIPLEPKTIAQNDALQFATGELKKVI